MIQPNSLALWLASHQAAPRKLRHGKGSALIASLEMFLAMSLRYRIAGARKCDDDLVIDYLNSKLGRGTHRFHVTFGEDVDGVGGAKPA